MKSRLLKSFVSLAGFLLIFTAAQSSHAISRFVATTGSDVGDCSDSNAPCQTIQFAITQSGTGDDIQIAAGQYNENNLLIAAGLELTFNGAGPGTDPNTATIIDGGAVNVVFSNNSDNVMFSNLTLQNGDGAISNNGNFLVIDNLLIRANNAGDSAIFNNGNNFSITNTNILNNMASSSGGGIFNNGADFSITNTNILNNMASSSGGGIFNNGNGGRLDLVNIVGNQSGPNGGGMFNNGHNLTLNQVNIDDNESVNSFGGGLFNNGNNLTTNFLSISGNRAENSGVLGGGMFNNGHDLNLTDCALNNNRSDSDGGAMFNNGNDLIINRCSFSGNTITGALGGDGDGGAIFNNGSFLTFLNSTLSNNTAFDEGGAIFENGSSNNTLVNVTMAGNNADTASGVSHNGSGDYILQSSILANATNGANCGGSGTYISSGYNIGDDNSCPLGGTGDQPNTNPMLGMLQDNGGNTLTQALLLGSPAIDQIPVADCDDADGNPLTVDQRNLPRPNGPACDVGAFEFSAGVFQFDMANYTVNEDAGVATITVIRTGGSDGDATVDFATSDGTAMDAVNYLSASGTLGFAQNDTAMTFDVTILNDNLASPDLTVNLALSNPTGGTSLGSPNPAILTIVDQGGNFFVSGGSCHLMGNIPAGTGWTLLAFPAIGLIFRLKRRTLPK
jgi:hypothetical protein